jgi:hypothetical protein
MLGLAGIGYHLLSLHDHDLPSVLVPCVHELRSSSCNSRIATGIVPRNSAMATIHEPIG